MKKILINQDALQLPYITVVFQNENKNIITLVLQEGCDCNLLKEDIEDGYVDYVDYSFTESETGSLSEPNGGMLLLENILSDIDNGRGLTCEKVLDEIIKMEDFVPISDIFIF